ncbi:[Histone H3]-lysine-36 demethylase [Aspergillus glaucus CBS 516.65]|uniref:JmjC domain-containing histone demethylation protein 1 n=1 Tax=Aspergillus glaucus CBS 516.65 TaxID=1160497 RepID=A0A1L9VVY8_ASPGL|nr:hypothetical protein ASPGLDRAFT_32528 [Aspergillus glaucus CBS 516.65]OJJ88070.1 hypothetical protein ASPGLDRAFT_32528 [Aspergillus glaucus CBS 516.65]
MMGATSFLNHLGSRPPRYRTPSPPRRAVEPITPSSNTIDFRASWTERNIHKHASSDRDRLKSENGRYAVTDDDSHNRSGHGRSSSTIDTLATIALATSPTFTPHSYRPPSQSSTPAMPLFPEMRDSIEPPTKRQRSEKDPSPFQPSPHAPTNAAPSHTNNSSSIFDSMKTDAELLLNFARPSNFPPIVQPPKRVSIDGSSHDYGNESKRQKIGSGSTYMVTEHEGSMYNASGNCSRTRSQSDGSTVARPIIRDVRPNTSSSTVPPITWQEEMEYNWNTPGTSTQKNTAHNDVQGSGARDAGVTQQPMDVPSKTEGGTDVDDPNQASCSACNLVRIPVETEDQGEVTWISCDGCKQWFHIVCAGFKNDREIRTVDKFICRGCWPVYGHTTFVRKSSRARTAIDYAGLNQGLVKVPSNSMEHHYIEPIRQGKIRFLPENFARMHPDLVTAEYFERGSGMSEPIVIPAHLNSRESTTTVGDDFDALAADAPTQEMFDELLEHLPEEGQNYERVIDCGQDRLDMVIPEGLNVRTVAELYGPEERVEVIDVKSQQGEDKRWNMQKWADYYESTGEKIVRNVISLEVSQSRLGRLIRRPKIVRDLDLQDAVWPQELQAIGDFPKVQFYCLMSVADCYTDFHIDFGGSSVYYHILKGKKTFFFIPPKDKHLKKYEEWCSSPAQDNTFLGDQTKECYRVDLSEGDTMLIPSGWIHAVWTPENSLVIGGNFLTRLNYGMQIKIAKIEKDTKVPRKFRYPFFQKIQWYTALKYLEEDPVPQSVLDAFAQDENYKFHRDYPVYCEFGERDNEAPAGSPHYNSRFYSQGELEGLPDLTKYLFRTALIASSYLVEGVTMEARNAIKRSIPKGIGDPVDTIRKFGVWVAWKRGNEKAAEWTRPGVIESNPKISLTEKKPAGRPSRRSERNADNQRMYAERQAVQLPEQQQQQEPSDGHASADPAVLPQNSVPAQANLPSSAPAVKQEIAPKARNANRGSGLGPKRVACDACRKRRIRCRHKDEQNDGAPAKPMVLINNSAFGQGMELQNQSSLGHDDAAAAALNSLAAVASEAGLQDGSSIVGLNQFEAAAKYNPAVTNTPTVSRLRTDGSPEGANSGKKGRSKACDDCRKSKRRCIHDEYGRVDPVKAQERSKPRASNSAKRPRLNEEDASLAPSKKPKQESTSPLSRPANLDGVEVPSSTIVHKAVGFDTTFPETVNPNKPLFAANVTIEEKAGALGQDSYASPPAFQTDTLLPKEDTVSAAQPTATLVSPPTSQADEMDVSQDNVDGEGEHPSAIHTPTSSSRHSSRQPRQVERYAPEGKTPRPASHPSSARQAFATSAASRKTPPAPSSGPKRPSSRLNSSHAPATEARHAGHHGTSASASTSPGQAGKRQTHEDPDAESMRLIRELQEQEFGLRKRTTRA